MNVIISINNKIQQYIIEYLNNYPFARFRDLKPPRTDTNLLSYHVTKLLNMGVIKKQGDFYELDALGHQYIDRVVTYPSTRTEPGIRLAFVIQDEEGNVLLAKEGTSWCLPTTSYGIDDASIHQSANVYLDQYFKYDQSKVRHAGDCYVRLRVKDIVIENNLFHVIRAEIKQSTFTEECEWVGLYSIPKYSLTPGTDAIISRSFFGDGFFFEEFDETLYTE